MWRAVLLGRGLSAILVSLRLEVTAWLTQPRLLSPFQTHPNVDKKLFTAESQIGLKNPEKSFPINSDVGVLKWRLQTTEESFIPLTSECGVGGSSAGRAGCPSVSCLLAPGLAAAGVAPQ